MKKNLIQYLFNFFHSKKEKTNIPSSEPKTPRDSDLPLNKFGQPESLINQCENHTCICGPTECKIDDQICYESVLLSTYVSNMRKAKNENQIKHLS